MVEVFITNVEKHVEANKILSVFERSYPELKINFDLNDSGTLFPCGHTILRVEGAPIYIDYIISTVNKSGYIYEILEDKACE